MTFREFHQQWSANIEADLEFFRAYEEEFPPFDKWEIDWSPDVTTERIFHHALELLYSGNPEHLAAKFLDWVIERIDRAIAEDKFSHPRAAFPHNRAHGVRARAHARFLRDGSLALEDLRQAIADLETYNQDIPRHQWDAQSEADVLAPARLALIVGDFDCFATLLPFRWPVKWHHEESGILVEINRCLAEGQSIPPELSSRFLAYFEQVRSPEFRPDIYTETDILRFELGILYSQYIDPSEPLTPQRVIDVVSR